MTTRYRMATRPAIARRPYQNEMRKASGPPWGLGWPGSVEGASSSTAEWPCARPRNSRELPSPDLGGGFEFSRAPRHDPALLDEIAAEAIGDSQEYPAD
jgi:hypothetical protein